MTPARAGSYFPSLPEIMVSVGMFAIEVLGYIVIVRCFPMLPERRAEPSPNNGGDKHGQTNHD